MAIIFKNLINSTDLSPAEIKELFLYASRIAFNYLRKKYSDDNHKFLDSFSTLKDISLDAVTPLFTKSIESEYLGIIRAFRQFNSQIKTESQAQYLICKIVWNRCEQEITKKLKENDPFFAKILENINYLIKRSNYAKTTYFGKVYIVEKEDQKINSFVLIEADDLTIEIFKSDHSRLLERIFDYLKRETDYFPAIPLNSLCRKIKNLYSSDFNSFFNNSSQVLSDDKMNIDNVVNDSLDVVIHKLEICYYSKGKLNSDDSDIIKKALTDISIDLKNGGMHSGLFEYLKNYRSDLTSELYYKKYQHTLDYLVRFLKKEIISKLEA